MIKIGKGKGIEVEFYFGKEKGDYIFDGKRIRYDLGKKKEFEEEDLRNAMALVVSKAKKENKDVVVKGLEGIEEHRFAYLITEGFVLSSFEISFKSKKEKKKEINLYLDIKKNKENREAVEKARIYGEAQNYARELANLPPNIGTPEGMRDRAVKLGKKLGLMVRVIDKKEMEDLGMNTILAVNRGSGRGAYLIELGYNGKKGKDVDFIIVGKGITFDSGGLQVKPGRYMLDMHLDKTGACVALGVIKAIAERKLKINAKAIVVFTENMSGSNAYKPREVIKSYSGKTIEIEHTDAEGRLILADALAYASKQKPKYIFDVATLTGAISVCLGQHAIGLFSNNEELVEKIKKAGEREGERVWSFPMFKEYRKMLDSDIADIRNIGSWEGEAGSITAAKFLEEFVKGKWAHFDIAGVMKQNKDYLGNGKRGTATGVRVILESLEELF